MLDLGFLEDVEKILSLTPVEPPDGAVLGDDAAADPQARRPLHVRPGDHPGRGGDAHDRHRRAVPAAGRGHATSRSKLVEVLSAEKPGPGDRVRAHEDPLRPALPHAARPRHERARAARRHVAGLARRGDAGLQGRACADPRRHRRRRPWPGHLDRHARHQLRRARRRRTPTCTASGAPAASVARAARSRSSSPARSASSRRSNGTSAPRSRSWQRGRERHADAGAGAPAAPLKAARRRDATRARSLRQARARRRSRGRPARAPTSSPRSPRRAGLEGEAVRDVLRARALSRSCRCPPSEADRVIDALDGHDVRGPPARSSSG